MAVAKEQVGELQEILRAYVEWDEIPEMIKDLRGTVAYQENQSFRETIELLANEE